MAMHANQVVDVAQKVAEVATTSACNATHLCVPAPATPPIPVEWQWVVDNLMSLGIRFEVASEVTLSAQGDFDSALEAALTTPQPDALSGQTVWDPSWDSILIELFEMGFNDELHNRRMVAQHEGHLKDVVAALVKAERGHFSHH